MPSVGVTGILCERLVCTVVDSEMEGHGTVAAILIGGNECGCIRRGIIISPVPQSIITRC